MIFIFDIFVIIFSLWIVIFHQAREGEVYVGVLLMGCFVYMLSRYTGYL
jgi:hypothetical protein